MHKRNEDGSHRYTCIVIQLQAIHLFSVKSDLSLSWLLLGHAWPRSNCNQNDGATGEDWYGGGGSGDLYWVLGSHCCVLGCVQVQSSSQEGKKKSPSFTSHAKERTLQTSWYH